VVDLRRDEAPLLSEPEVAVCDDRVAVPPCRDVLLVEQVADAAGIPAAGGDRDYLPGLPAVARVRDEDVRVRRVHGADEPETERAVVRVSARVECERRIARALVGRARED